MTEHRVTLYVKSVKTFTRTEMLNERSPISRGSLPPAYTPRAVPMYEYVLPDDQKTILDVVETVARRFSVQVRVIDVARESLVEREIQEHFERIRVFPALTDDLGRRIEGDLSREKVVSFLAALKAENQYF